MVKKPRNATQTNPSLRQRVDDREKEINIYHNNKLRQGSAGWWRDLITGLLIVIAPVVYVILEVL